ncbi:ACP phosphodiesterase [Pedobacter rhizosphaerae]|uniref:Acyl carrier protein phosphodiesterase n=1 Tax=Pedobacter rhizosphaerae TaxID=390241 RepID=A0A1H9V2F5_9SPHI|nr:ACP phosphodiesterase [Pedobacter rhizosphaerae]SES15493.1 Acyl carrier protein phosphodiesterase [Pedobacter rhizosphaerae]
MNFLSHYYFDRLTADPSVVMGTVLPDLVKNASKESNLYPQKNEFLFLGNPDEEGLLKGWKRHLAVDLYFHSSDFFLEKTTALKLLIKPIVENTVVRPSFLAHIGLELLLDHLLIEHNLVQVNQFYDNLSAVNPASLADFLEHCGLKDQSRFHQFLTGFISSKYLLSYQKLDNISYALNRICMRLWPETLNEEQLQQLTFALGTFKETLEKDFMEIFHEIERSLVK